MADHVTIFTTNSCAFCHAEKRFLQQRGIRFDERQVDDDGVAAAEMIELSGQMGVPVTVITGSDGSIIDSIIGFNQPRLEQALVG